jgi:hypothetical protein
MTQETEIMNATPAFPAPLPVPLRSEAFPEDILEFVEHAQPGRERSLRWLVNLAPLGVALLGVAFAVVPMSA